jgi:hypothetical protein
VLFRPSQSSVVWFERLVSHLQQNQVHLDMAVSFGVRVVVRIRPVNEREQREMGQVDPSVFAYAIESPAAAAAAMFDEEDNGSVGRITSQNIQVTGKTLGGSEFRGTFDRIFDCPTTQDEVFTEIAAPAVRDVMRGYNGTNQNFLFLLNSFEFFRFLMFNHVHPELLHFLVTD